MEKKHQSSIIVMAFPDSFVALSTEKAAKIAPYLGLGNKHGIKAGHAALCTVDHETGEVHYYDFGRYITPHGYGRVRSAKTDHELVVPIKAEIIDNEIKNIREILLWLEAHPEKTHGDGMLVASLCSDINKEKAQNFIDAIHTKGSIPYGVFVKNGSNCVRFVHDTLRASCENKRTLQNLGWESLITPSPLGVVSRSANMNHVYTVLNGEIKIRKPYSTIGSWKYLFEKPEAKKESLYTCNIENVCYLTGIGSSAYFKLETTKTSNEYLITRFTDKGDIDCQNIFTTKDNSFDPKQNYNFVYDSNCNHCHIQQGEKTYRFDIKKDLD